MYSRLYAAASSYKSILLWHKITNSKPYFKIKKQNGKYQIEWRNQTKHRLKQDTSEKLFFKIVLTSECNTIGALHFRVHLFWNKIILIYSLLPFMQHKTLVHLTVNRVNLTSLLRFFFPSPLKSYVCINRFFEIQKSIIVHIIGRYHKYIHLNPPLIY